MNATVEKTNANGNGANGCADVRENGDSSGATDGSGNANEIKPAAISSDVSLPNEVLERLFQRYSIKQRRAGLECFLATSVLFDLWVIFVPQHGKSFENVGTYSICYLLQDISFSLSFTFVHLKSNKPSSVCARNVKST